MAAVQHTTKFEDIIPHLRRPASHEPIARVHFFELWEISGRNEVVFLLLRYVV